MTHQKCRTGSARPYLLAAFLLGVLSALPLAAQEEGEPAGWQWSARAESRLNFRDSRQEKFTLRFPFRPDELPPGVAMGSLETVHAGRHGELSVLQVTLDVKNGPFFAARARLHGRDLYRRNPTSEDRKTDADELWIRVGERPEKLELPSGSSLFLQIGKAPKMERQPVRLLESYGLASNAFNRFEDVQLLVGGSLGRYTYWRAQVSSGNPLFFRDTNALAGDNGVDSLRRPNPNPHLKSGFPVLYNAEAEGLSFKTKHAQYGGGLGARWQGADGSGIDALVYHYQRTLAEEADLTGTFYGGDLDLLDGLRGISLPIQGNEKQETGVRLYGEWRKVSLIAQAIRQQVAGLNRSGYELETGVSWPLAIGPAIRGRQMVSSIQPALRVSALINHFRGPPTFVAPSLFWDWTKIDLGVRIGLLEDLDLTIERAVHTIDAARKLEPTETLVTLRIRI